MGEITDRFLSAWRYWNTDGVPASGAHQPSKEEIQAIGAVLEAVIGTAVGGLLRFETKALMDADETRDDGTLAYVWNDTTPENNAIYQWDGSDWVVADWYYDSIASIVQPLVDAAEAAEIAAESARDEAVAAAASLNQFTDDITGVGSFSVYATGHLADPAAFYPRPVALPAGDSLSDILRYHDEAAIRPTAALEYGVMFNSSANWGALAGPSNAIRMVAGAYDGTTVHMAGKGFTTASTTDLAPAGVDYGTCTVDGDVVTPVSNIRLVTDSSGVNRLAAGPVVWNHVSEKLYVLFSRDDRDTPSNAKFYELVLDGGSWSGSAPFTPGSDDTNAREIAGIKDGTWTRNYFCPHGGFTDDDGTMFVTGWAVIGLDYVQFVLKRGIADGEWSRIWTMVEGADTGEGEQYVQGEQSVLPLRNGNLLIVGRGGGQGYPGVAWWEITKAGVFVATGFWDGLFEPQIGIGAVNIDLGDGRDRILMVGPSVSSGTGQNDVGMHAAISYVPDAGYYASPRWYDDYEPFRVSRTGAALDGTQRTYSKMVSSNVSMVDLKNGTALALIDRNGPTDAGTFGPYICVTGVVVNPANGIRNHERGDW